MRYSIAHSDLCVRINGINGHKVKILEYDCTDVVL